MLSTAIIAEAGKSVVAAGNVGPNALGELEKHRQVGTLPDFWVLELSSFQLETTESLHCDSAALLNITEDHIDWHGSMEKYAAAKRKIFLPIPFVCSTANIQDQCFLPKAFRPI